MRKKIIMILGILFAISLSGCSEKPVNEPADNVIVVETKNPEEDAVETPEQSGMEEVIETEIPDTENLVTEVPVTEVPVTEEAEVSGFSYADLKNLQFIYSSGAGAWATYLTINEDGTFSGEYHDSEMGSIGEGYPNGSCYLSVFQGAFSKPVKVNEYTYSVQVEKITYDQKPGTEEIIDEILYIYSEAAGLANSENIYIYLPDAPYETLPEGYKSWAWMAREDADAPKLSFYGLYNEKDESGFVSYVIKDSMEELMELTKVNSDILKKSLQEDVLSQTEMNLKSQELYELWDGVLNKLWKSLKEKLSDEAYQKLLTEQRQWIKDKEAAMEKAASEVKGGSMEPLLRNDTGASWTEQRVYELYELYRKIS